jgi:DNA-binding CsgD family transcriptional regulator
MIPLETLAAIEQLYASALVPGRWAGALQAMAEACGATGATIYRLPAAPERALTTPNLAEATDAYAATWWEHDSRAPGIADKAANGPLTDDDLVSPEARRRDPFYQEFLKGYDLGHFAAVAVSPIPGMRMAVTVERGSYPFETTDLQTFALLSRHAAQAVAAMARIGVTERFAAELATAVEHVACGMIFLDDRGRVRFVNPQAERLLGDGLAVVGERVLTARAADQVKLDGLIRRVLPGSAAPAGGSLFVARPTGKAPLVVQAHPIRARGELALEQLGLGTSGGVLLIHDLAGEQERSLLRGLEEMGLSRAEARVAELVGRGHSVKEAADVLGIVESTARTQLKAAYARLGIGRQSELAILITRLGGIGLV